jgi:hypothetical protein
VIHWVESGLVFTTKGRPLDARNVPGWFKKLLVTANEHIGPGRTADRA